MGKFLLRQLQADVIDEHYYKDPAWFLANAGRYDKYDRNGPKVFAGEYAAHVGGKRNNWESALAEAAVMTGLERNGDLVQMSSYAPLFAHVDAWQWAPNLIWFDNLHSYGTPNYYVQKLFSANRGKTILPISLDGARDGLFACASSGEGGEVVLKVVNTGATARPAQIKLSGERGPVAVSGGQLLVLVNSDRKAENTLDEPTRVAPVSKVLTGANGQLQHEFPPYSVSVVRVSAEMR